MVLDNKLGITNSIELAREEERLTKIRAKELFESGRLFDLEVGTFAILSDIHKSLFGDIFEFAGNVPDVNIAKDCFQFAPPMFLIQSLEYIDRLPHNSFDDIIDKYADMNIAHPFRKGNGRSMRIWLDCMLRDKLQQVLDWSSIDKDEYLNATKRSHVSTGELNYLLQQHLTDDLDKMVFLKGLDASYYYEGYTLYKTVEL